MSPCCSVIARASLVIRRLRDDRAHGVVGLRRRARDEQRVSARDDALGDGGDLGRRFAKPEDDFRKALPQMRDA